MAVIDTTFGVLFDGAVLSLVLYGITCSQFIYYHRFYPQDHGILKHAVTVLWVLDSFQQVLIVHILWHYLIELRLESRSYEVAFGNWSIIGEIIPTEITAILVECFFVYRIWILTRKSKGVFAFFVPMSICFTFSIGYVIKCYIYSAFAEQGKDAWLLAVFSGSRGCTDVAIALTMCYFLYKNYHDDFTSPTTSLIKAVMRHSITTGFVTSIFGILYLITYLAMPSNLVYIAVYFVHSKLYVSSMLASLNGRENLRALAEQDVYLGSPPRQRVSASEVIPIV